MKFLKFLFVVSVVVIETFFLAKHFSPKPRIVIFPTTVMFVHQPAIKETPKVITKTVRVVVTKRVPVVVTKTVPVVVTKEVPVVITKEVPTFPKPVPSCTNPFGCFLPY